MYEFGKWYLATGLVMMLFIICLNKLNGRKRDYTYILMPALWLPFLAWVIMRALTQKAQTNDSK